MEMLKKLIIAIAIVAATWMTGYVVGKKHFRDEVKMFQADTIVRFDTIVVEKPVLVERTVKEYRTVAVHDTTIVNDTIYAVLPIEKKI